MSRRLRRSDDGVVTAELAMALPLLLAVTVGLVWLLAVGAAQIQLIDATREVARAVARGEDRGASIALGQRIAPEGTRFAVEGQGDRVVVIGQASMRSPSGLLAILPAAPLRAESVAMLEPGIGEGVPLR